MINENNVLDYIDKVTPQWVAGFFDGEGSVSAILDSGKDIDNVKLTVTISQKNKFILLLIMMKYAGNLSILSKGKGHRFGATCQLNYSGSSALRLLEAIKDYCIVKHELVCNAIELAKLFKEGPGRRFISDEERKKRILLHETICKLNQDNRDYILQ